MRKIVIFQAFIFLSLGMLPAAAAHANDFVKSWKGVKEYWIPAPEKNMARPYMEDGKTPHNARWDNDEWLPLDWTASRGNAKNVIDGFYKADIITDQYFDDDIPVLEVGQGFLALGAQDQRRVVAYMDDIFGVTKYSPAKMMLIQFHKNDLLIGEYTAQGLQLQ